MFSVAGGAGSGTLQPMRTPLWWSLCTLLAAGCTRDAGARADAGAPERAARAAAEAADEDAAPYVLTAEKLDAFIQYQQQMNGVQAGLLRELQSLATRLDAGQLQDSKGAMAAMGRSLKVIEAKSRTEEQARKALSLTPGDVNRISRITLDVMSQRHLARLMKFDEELAGLSRTREKLPEGQRDAVDLQIARVKAQAAAYTDLGAARREHGGANVDLVLSREEALLRNHREMLEAH